MTTKDSVRALRWSGDRLEVLDQRHLPSVITFISCSTSNSVAESIRSMQVRGAPAIGIAAAYGVVMSARDRYRESTQHWRSKMSEDLSILANSRPTAVNLFWAIEKMQGVIREIQPDEDPYPRLLAEADKIHAEDVFSNHEMGQIGAAYLAKSRGILTHCNTGSLATGGYGTALGVIRSAQRLGPVPVFATETRPWFQGARLTIWELNQDQIPATLVADSAAAFLMKSGKVDWVIVGADRIAANGDTANKIGTYALAVAARYHGVKFMVVAPTSTIDWGAADGQAIEIEERDSSELLPQIFQSGESVIKAWNPVFDVTPCQLIDVIVTERGAVERPTLESMRQIAVSADSSLPQ